MKCNIDNFKKFNQLVDERQMTNKKASEILGYTPEGFCRLRKRYKKDGDKTFIHGLKGKPSNHKAIALEIKKKIHEFYITDCQSQNVFSNSPNHSLNFMAFTEELNLGQGLKVSYSSVYKILHYYGINCPKSHKKGKINHHDRTFRREAFGELLQLDATPFEWFHFMGDNHKYALHGVLDDATNMVLALYLCENECRLGYIACRRLVLEKYGIECEDYTDRSPVFHNNTKERDILSVDEQLGGAKKKLPLWEVLNKELGVKLSLANSPQAKGKIERMWQTMQARLPFEIKKHGFSACDISKVNEWLNNEFLNYYNSRFGIESKVKVNAFRKVPDTTNLNNILCVKEAHIVYRDGTIKFRGLRLKIKGLKYWHSRLAGDLCINESGLFFLLNETRYEVDIKNGELSYCNVPQVLDNIIKDTLYSDVHTHIA